MKIRDMISKGEPTVSFEIFPPKSSYSLDTVFDTLHDLKDLHPDFISVTYGAGGTAQSNTVEIASRIKKDFGIESIAHLTGCTSTKEGMKRTLASIKDSGIENILALRGDIPAGKIGGQELETGIPLCFRAHRRHQSGRRFFNRSCLLSGRACRFHKQSG